MVSTVQPGHCFLESARKRKKKKLKTVGHIKVNWLVGGKKKRIQKKRRNYMEAFREEKGGGVGYGGMKWSPVCILIDLDILLQLSRTNKDRFVGAPTKGGWVVDNFPSSTEHWAALTEKELLPDILICLKNTEQNGLWIFCKLTAKSKTEFLKQ